MSQEPGPETHLKGGARDPGPWSEIWDPVLFLKAGPKIQNNHLNQPKLIIVYQFVAFCFLQKDLLFSFKDLHYSLSLDT